MPLESSSLAKCDGRISRGGEGKEHALDKSGRIRRPGMDKDMDVNTNIPGLGQIPSRAQENKEQVPDLNLGTRVPTPSDSRAFVSFQLSPSNPDDWPSYTQSQVKHAALLHREEPSILNSVNNNMTCAEYLYISSSTDPVQIGPKRKPASSNTSHPVHDASTQSSRAKTADNPDSKLPPTRPRAHTAFNLRSNSPDRRIMKGLPPTGPRATRPPPALPSSFQGLPPSSLFLSTTTPRGPRAGGKGSSTPSWRVSDADWASKPGSAGLSADQRKDSAVRYDSSLRPGSSLELPPPLEGRDALQFTLPSSPLPQLSFPTRDARRVEMEEPQDKPADTQAVKDKGKRTKDALHVCVMVPRLSEAERRRYLHWLKEESLGSMSMVSSNPGCSVTSPQCSLFPRRRRSSRSSASSSTQRSSLSLPISHMHRKRKTKFLDIQEGTAEYEEVKVIHIPRGDAAPSTSKAVFLKAPAMEPTISEPQKRKVVTGTAPPQKRRRTASPPRVSHPPSESLAPQDAAIASISVFGLSKSPCDHCVAADEPCTWSTVNEATGLKRKRGPQRKSCNRCITVKRACIIAPPSDEQAGVDIEEQEDYKLNEDGPGKRCSKPGPQAAEEVLCPDAPIQLVTPQSSPPSSIHRPSPDLDDEIFEKKGKARAIDDDDDIVELAGGKKGKHVQGEGGERAKKASTEDMAHSTSSSKILTLEFQEEMDDQALYSVMMEPGANNIDLGGGAWNYEQSWGTQVHVIGSLALRRNLKGYRRLLLGNDEWYEGEDDEEYEENCEVKSEGEEEEAVRALMLSGAEDKVTEAADLNDENADVYDSVVETESITDADGLDITLVARRQAISAIDNQRPAELGSPLDDVVPGIQSEDNPPVTSTSPEPERRRHTLDSKYRTRPDAEEACCHQCRRKSKMVYMQCMNLECATVRGRILPGKRYCVRCIREYYDEYNFVEGEVDMCPACKGICSCDRCNKKQDPYAQRQWLAENAPTGKRVRHGKLRKVTVGAKTK